MEPYIDRGQRKYFAHQQPDPRPPPVSYRGFAAFPSKAIAAGDTLVSVLTDLAVGLNMLLCGKHMSYLQPPAVP